MSVNSSSSSLPSNSSFTNFYDYDYGDYWDYDDVLWNCFVRAEAFSLIAFTVTSILLVLPLCIYVIYLGFQRWRQQRSGSTMSHFDIFTYHLVFIELMNIVGHIIVSYGAVTHLLEGRSNFTHLKEHKGMFLISISISGQLLFHTLTCVERYLAVVHPITYLGLRNAKGIRIRNISIGCVWLLSFSETGFLFMSTKHAHTIFVFCALSFIFLVISFCCLSVLYVLIRPGPGAGGEGRQRVDQSKRRAFYTIMAILGVLLLRVVGSVVDFALLSSLDWWEFEFCGAFLSLPWLNLPSSLVLPLLFLHGAGKLLCCKNSNTSGQGSV